MNPLRTILAAALLAAAPLAAPASPAPAGEEIADLFKRVKDSVVVLKVNEREVVASPGGVRPVGTSSTGSGFLVHLPKKADGSDGGIGVMTAAHVVQVADHIEVEFPGGASSGATVLGSSQIADVALLSVDRMPEKAAALELGDSDAVEPGDRVIVVGAPYGLDHSVSAGIVSARRRTDEMPGGLHPLEFFQTDAAINQGNSGGPMISMKGEVIGVVSNILTKSGGFEGMGFVVSSNLARRLLLDERSPWWGVDAVLLPDFMVRVLNVPRKSGMLVQRVALASPAQRAGIHAGSVPAVVAGREILLGGDVILSVNGVPVEPDRLGDLRKAVLDRERGSKMVLEVLYDGAVRRVEVDLPSR